MSEPRLRPVDRSLLIPPRTIDQTIDADHPVRYIAEYVEQLDLSDFLATIKAVDGVCGRDANDPKMLLILWMYATVDGVGSARRIDKLCRENDAYRWILGGLSINYHSISSFRNRHAAALEKVMIRHISALLSTGAIELKCVAQDGMKTRASAGNSSFHRSKTIEECSQAVQTQIEQLKKQTEEDPGAVTRREQSARLRAAKEKQQRLKAAREAASELEQKQEKRDREHPSEAEARKKKPESQTAPRASTTDPQSRRMKMPDGGTRPAYNIQFSTDVESKIILGVDVSNQGNDGGLLMPMVEQIETNFGQCPKAATVDGSYVTSDDIEAATKKEVIVYAPIKDEQKQLDAGKDPYQPKKGDSQAMKDFRQRMGTEEAKKKYRQRAETAEWVNAGMRNRGMYQLRVRGLRKVRTVFVLQTMVHNLLETRRRCEQDQKNWNWMGILRALRTSSGEKAKSRVI